MIPELGHFALVLALLLALIQSSLPLVGAARGDAGLMAVARPAALGQFAAIALAFLALSYAHIVSDFTVGNVVANSHSTKPLLYRIAGVWGNHEGSMVLWVLILALFGGLVAAFGANLPPSLRARVLAVQGMIGVGFLLFILATSNPFLRVDPPPLDGNDLNPILQDPGLAFHPPMLYFGYVGFSMAFSFAVAALIEGRVDAAWARWVRPWTLAAWCGLTLGIALGSWWAYYELGWGGWWFWDPVENASLMPWLAGTALLHSAIVVEKRDALKSWTILLAILTFGLSLIGTFLVRSGVLTSVHAFANDPARGVFILILLVVAIGGSLTLYAVRAPALKPGGLFAPVSREGALVLNNLLLTTAAATVFIGTLYPLFLEAIGGGTVSVGPPFYDATFVPLMAPLVAAMAVGPLLAWKRGDLAGALGRLLAAAAVAAGLVAAAAYVHRGGPALALLGVALSAWAILGALSEFAERIRLFRVPVAESGRRALGLPRSAWGMTLAHIGLGVAIAGMTGSAWREERIDSLRPGDSVTVAGYTVAFEGVEPVDGPNYAAARGRFTVTRDGEMVARMRPEKRRYMVTRVTTTEAAIHTNWLADLYVVLGEPQPAAQGVAGASAGSGSAAPAGGPEASAPPSSDAGLGGAWSVRIYHTPLAPWIWLGALVMAAGGAVSLSDRRLRVGAPARRRYPVVPASAQPAE